MSPQKLTINNLKSNLNERFKVIGKQFQFHKRMTGITRLSRNITNISIFTGLRETWWQKNIKFQTPCRVKPISSLLRTTTTTGRREQPSSKKTSLKRNNSTAIIILRENACACVRCYLYNMIYYHAYTYKSPAINLVS